MTDYKPTRPGNWTASDVGLPPEGVEVQTMDTMGHLQNLIRDGRRWFLPDRSMEVYYVPTFWQPL